MFRGPAHHWPLAARLTTTVTALLALAVVVMTVLSIQQQQAALRSELTTETERMVSALAASWLDPIIELDVDFLGDAMVGLEGDPEVLDVHVYDADGRLIASLTSLDQHEHGSGNAMSIDESGRSYVSSAEQTTRWEGDGVMVARSVRIGQRVFGAISVELSTGSLGAESAGVRWNGILLGLAVILTGGVATVIMSRTITSPLRDLTVAAEMIARGRMEQEVPVRGGDEVGRLTTTFNEMAGRIRETVGELERERGRFESIAESLSVGLMIVDQAGAVSYVNGSFREMLHLSNEQVVGRTPEAVGERLQIAGRSSAEPAVAGRLFVKGDVALEFDLRVGSRVIAVSGFSVEDRLSGLERGYIFADVTDARQVERLKSEFVAIASHELRTPLTGMLGFSSLLAESEDLPEAERRWAALIQRESSRLSDIVTALLNVSRIESGEIDVERAPIRIEEVIEGVVATFSGASNEHTLRVEGPTDAVVLGDGGKLTEVLGNLVDNAIKYSPKGGEVVIRCVPRPGELEVRVQDSGLGVPELELPKLFTRFHRVRRPEYEDIRSTGLGLYLVRQYMEHMGGSVGVESVEGAGSTFHFSVPLDHGAAQELAKTA